MSLKSRLTTALVKAVKTPGEHQTVPLGGGLVIQVYVEPDGQVHLLLKRYLTFPAELEWQTVLSHWPQPLPVEPPTFMQQKVGDWYALTGNWKPPRPVFGSPP